MRADRGFLCANEIQLGLSIPDAELALFRHKMSANAFFDTVQLAHRWTGPSAQAAGFVHAVVSEDDLLPIKKLGPSNCHRLGPIGHSMRIPRNAYLVKTPPSTKRMAQLINCVMPTQIECSSFRKSKYVSTV